MIFRRLTSAFLALLGGFGCLLLIGHLIGMDHTLAKSQDMDRQLREAGGGVLAFQRAHQRLPTPDEAEAILTAAGRGRYALDYVTQPSACDRNSPQYKALQASSYVLWSWRGEWAECYSPELNVTTVITTPEGYWKLGTLGRDRPALILVVLACFAGAYWLWRKPPVRKAGLVSGGALPIALIWMSCLLLAGCGFVTDERVAGPWRLVAVDSFEDTTLCRDLGEDGTCVGDGLPGPTVFSAGADERYAVLKRHPLGADGKINWSVTEYYYLRIRSEYVQPGDLVGPLSRSQFEAEARRLRLPPFTKTLRNLE